MEALDILVKRLDLTLPDLKRLSDLAESVRTTRPQGYATLRSGDGVSRPVEDVIVALDDRGVTAALYNAGHHLEAAIYAAEWAVDQLNEALNRWEGHGT